MAWRATRGGPWMNARPARDVEHPEPAVYRSPTPARRFRYRVSQCFAVFHFAGSNSASSSVTFVRMSS